MRFSDMIAKQAEADELADKKRLGKNQKVRLATLSDELRRAKQPPATPRRLPTGQRADFQGNVFAAHYRNTNGGNIRETRRANASGRYAEKPLRSRIQRARRKQRTGGVK